jgi:plasmid stabilization system protein ParE
MGDGRRVVFWTGAARDSLDEILTFIALDSPAMASKVAAVVLGAAESRSSGDASFRRWTLKAGCNGNGERALRSAVRRRRLRPH